MKVHLLPVAKASLAGPLCLLGQVRLPRLQNATIQVQLAQQQADLVTLCRKVASHFE